MSPCELDALTPMAKTKGPPRYASAVFSNWALTLPIACERYLRIPTKFGIGSGTCRLD